MIRAVLFTDWLIRNGKHNNTVNGHLKKLRVLERSIADWSEEQLNKFILNLKREGKSNATINHYIDTIRVYSRYIGSDIDLTKIKYLKKQESLKAVLSDTEVEEFLNLPCPPKSQKSTWELDTLFFSCTAYSGARPSEIATLKRKDVTDKYFLIRHSKTGKPRIVPIAENIRPLIVCHLKALQGDTLFVTRKGNIYSDHNWLHAFNRRVALLGIQREGLTLYSLRHSMATELYRKKVPAQVIAKLLGNSIDMVEKTYAHMVTEDVEEALRQHPTIGRKADPKVVMEDLINEIEKFKLSRDSRFDYNLSYTGEKVKLSIEIKQTPIGI